MPSDTKYVTRSRSTKKLGSGSYIESNQLPIGVLPSKKQVVECMMYIMRQDRAGKSHMTVDDGAYLVACSLIDQWLYCNIYTVTLRVIKKRVLNLYKDFQNEMNKAKKPFYKKPDKQGYFDSYNQKMLGLFDIFCEDALRRKNLEKMYSIKMQDMEYSFLEDMRSDRIQYCEDAVDRRWKKTMERRTKQEKALDKMKDSEKSRKDEEFATSSQLMEIDAAEDHCMDTDRSQLFTVEPGPREKGKKRPFQQSTASCSDSIPSQFRHIRTSQNVVKTSFYKTVDILMSQYHCSKVQAVAGVIVTGKVMFDRNNWKFHHEDPNCIDLDTAPDKRSILRAEQAFYSLSLGCLVEEIMDADQNTVITYHNDGSRVQGTGGYCVQGVTVNGKYRRLPALPISSECRENLALLKQTILTILSSVSGVPPQDLFKKINYQMTDATSHTLQVDDLVAADLGVDHIPQHLLCHTHPALMFNRKIVDTFKDIENQIGSDKIYSSFLVNATTHHASVFEQYSDCITRLISPDFDHKSWNYSDEFKLFIAPRKNLAVALKMERFNRFVYLCAVVLYIQDDVTAFLDKYDHITNTLACIVRSFESAEYLSVFCAVGALVGIHLTQPYLSITYYDPLKYQQLIPAMQTLYSDLQNTTGESLFDITKPAFKFISNERFKESCKWPKEIMSAVSSFVLENRQRVKDVLDLVLPRLADGFFLQRGNVFGFGDFDRNSNQLLTVEECGTLNQAPINNIDSERDVGSVNYELKLRGAKQLATCSRSHVKAKLGDLLELKPVDAFKNHYKNADKVSAIVKLWKGTQEELKKHNLSAKEAEHLSTEKRKMSDLDKLREFGGPFSKQTDVDVFLARDDITESMKQTVLYLQVRYARDTCLSLPKSSQIFRLKKDYRNLPYAVYAQNLKVYLSKVECKAGVTWEDFDQAIQCLQ